MKKDIEKYEKVYYLVDPNCEIVGQTHEAILCDNAVILYEHLFNKVGKKTKI